MSWACDAVIAKAALLLGRMAAGAALLVGVAVLAHWPVGRPADGAALRMALRTVGTRVEACRERSQAELAKLPAHMRQPRVCERYALPYRLLARIDGQVAVERQIDPAGIRHDRPVGLDVQVPLAPGVRTIAIGFEPVPPPLPPGGYPPEVAAALASARRYSLHVTAQVQAGRVLLVMLDRDRDRLELHAE